VVAVLLWQVARSGDSRLCWAAVAQLAGTSVTTVKEAIRDGRRLGILMTRERRHVGRRSETTIVTIADVHVRQWVERRSRSGERGGAEPPSFEQKKKRKAGEWRLPGLSGASWRDREPSRRASGRRLGVNHGG
jgi:hypothetical protein